MSKNRMFEVLRDTNMPAVLGESGFIDSAIDTARLKDPNYRQSLAVAYVTAMCIHFGLPKYKEKGVTPVATPVSDP